jgi:ABC-type multidrug transport system ATPase subunit
MIPPLREASDLMTNNQRYQLELPITFRRTINRPIDRRDEVAPERASLVHGLTVGRQPMPGQVVLDHPNVSRRHAIFEVADGAFVLRDLGGTNGTYVNGVRLRGACQLRPGDRIDIGPFELTFDGSALTRAWRVGNVELLVQGASYDVRGRQPSGGARRILDCANLRIRPSEFVAIIGANGSGKSTLMNVMGGRSFPSEGAVLLNGVDLHTNFPALRQDIAFVSQQDVLHEQLALRHALDYAAWLRLPRDTTTAQRYAAVNEAARSVDLLDRLDQRIGTLSGGQKKRASLASEILNRPNLLLLDEVTSGLDESTDWEIMRLLRRLGDDGMTIVVVTHTLANVAEFCDRIVCMGRGGRLTFVGAPSEVLKFFAVDRLGGVFGRMDELGAEHWHSKFEKTIGATVNLAAATEPRTNPRPDLLRPRKPALVALQHVVRQGAILLHRNARLLLVDRRTLVMAAVQSVMIGGLMGYAFGNFGESQERVNAESALLLLLGLCAVWLGCNAASKEIVGELAIYKREHDINVSTAAFICAKYLVSAAFTVLQLAVVYALVGALAEDIPGDRVQQFLLLMIGAMAGTAIGLVISALANTRDQATTIVPLALVPQLILAGVLVPNLPDLAKAIAKIAVSGYWLTEAMKSVFIAAEGTALTINARNGTLVEMTAEPVGWGAGIVAMHALTFLVIAYSVTMLRHGRRRHGS